VGVETGIRPADAGAAVNAYSDAMPANDWGGWVVFHSTRVLLSFEVPAGPSINGASHAKAASRCGSRRRDHVRVLSGRAGTRPERAGLRDRYGHAASGCAACDHDAPARRGPCGGDTGACRIANSACGIDVGARRLNIGASRIDHDHEGFERHAGQGN
jgi:hypothetical protein